MKHKIVFCVLTISFLASCAKATPPVLATSPVTETLAPTHTTTVAPTNTSMPKPIPTVTVTETPVGKVAKNCLPVDDKETALQDVAIGTIIYSSAYDEQVFAKDLLTGQQYPLPAEKDSPYPFWSFRVSPDGNKLAYLETTYDLHSGEITKTVLWVVNAHGGTLRKITFNYGIWYPRWLDNEWLIFYIWETDKNGRELMVNPFRHEQHYVWNELPNFHDITKMWWISWLADYSPDLKWVVYWDDWKTTVYDVEREQDIWKSPPMSYGEHTWSPTGNELAVATWWENPNLYILNRTGVVKTLLDDNEKNIPQRPSWSPDGRYLAFLNSTAMLYDKQTDQVTDYCIEAETSSTRPLLWSPNSQQFVLDGDIDQGTAHHVLIDIQKNAAYKLSDFSFLAWMNSLP